MAEVSTVEQEELVKSPESLTEDDIYGHPERDQKWLDAQEETKRWKAAGEFRKGLAEKRHKVLRDRFDITKKPTEAELEALQKSGDKISPEQFIEYLDKSKLDLPLKEALVQNFSEYQNMRATYGSKEKVVNENYLVKQLEENRPKEPLNLPQNSSGNQSNAAALK